MKIAFQMEPLRESQRGFTNSLFFIEEACKRGYEVWQFEPEALSLSNHNVTAVAHRVWVNQSKEEYYTLGKGERLALDEMDVIFMRNHPPFDMKYISATYMLEGLCDKVLFVNNPYWVRNCPEKLFPFEFPEFIPPTLISRDIEAIKEFRAEHKDIILKPPYEYYATGVMHLPPDDENFEAIISFMKLRSSDPIIVQRYIPEVKEGRVRVFFFDGEPVTARKVIYRSHVLNDESHWKQLAHDLTKKERKASDALGPILRERGLLFAGVDFIGDYLIEINITCPGGLDLHNDLYGERFEAKLWDVIEQKLSLMRQGSLK